MASSSRSRWRRSVRTTASLMARSMAGTSRTSLSLVMKSWAPDLSAATAVSSPMAPDTIMKGRSTPVLCSSCRASGMLKLGMAKSEMTTSQRLCRRAWRISLAVSTRVWVTS